MSNCLINGEYQNELVVTDRAIAYGDGIFTTAKVVNGQVEFITDHIARLVDGCAYLGIGLDASKLTQEIAKAVKNINLSVLKIIISAGSGGRGYSRVGCSSEQRILTLHDFPAHYQQWSELGIDLANSTLQLGLNPLLKGLKHLNRLEQVLIRAELDKLSVDDLLVTDIQGNIIETSCANIFWIKDGNIYTPEITDAGVLGIYRQKLLAFTNKIHTVKEKELDNIDAMFICNSVMGIVPIKSYNNMTLAVTPVIDFKQQFLASLKAV